MKSKNCHLFMIKLVVVMLVEKARKQLIHYSFIFVVFVFCSWIVSPSYAQEVTTDTTEERMDEASFKTLKGGYNYIIRAEEEELSMFKMDLLSTGLYPLSTGEDSDSIPISFLRLRFERKLKPNWSWQVGVDLQGLDDSFEEIHLLAGTRYYYNMNKRILKGKSANNFSADYLGLTLTNKFEPPRDNYGLSFTASYGLQRRLGKYGYLDFEVGWESIMKRVASNAGNFNLIISIQLGVAF